MDILEEAEEHFNRPLKSLADKVKGMLKTRLWAKVLLGMVLGITVGVLLGPDVQLLKQETASTITQWLALPGNLFLKLVKMIVIPLVFSSIIVGILSSGNIDFIKKIGPRILAFVLVTTSIAIIIGISLSYVIKPGTYINSSLLTSTTTNTTTISTEGGKKIGDNIPEKVVNVLPDNPLESMVEGEMLGVVLFTLILGVALLFVNQEKLKNVLRLLEVVQESSMIIVRWAMELAPLAVFGLMTQLTSKIGISTLSGLGVYVLTVVIGLLLMLVVYNLIILIFVRLSPMQFMSKIKEVLLLAFSTSSSAAVMPLSMKVAEEELGVRPAISRFLIPVGATINMAGTALYQSVAAVFLAQVFGIELSMSSLILIVVITVGSSIGTPSAPGVGIVILATILESVGIPTAGIALILGVDRLLDMSRTSVNVAGDITACAYFNKQMAADFDQPVAKEEVSVSDEG